MTHLFRKTRRPVPTNLRTAKPCLERLDERLLLSGFGPEDGAYIVEPWSGSYSAVQIQAGDQKIVAAGGTTSGLAIARYDSSGNPDASYGSGGLSTPAGGGAAGSLVLQPDGKAVVSTSNNFGVGRLNPNGSLDKSFSSDGWASINVNSLPAQLARGVGLQSNGQIVVGGQAGSILSPSAVLGGFKANGAVNSGKGGFGQIVSGKAIGYTVDKFGGEVALFSSIEVQPDNKIVAVGNYKLTTGGFAGQVLVARYTANGVLDTTFNSTGYTILTLPGISYTSLLQYGTDRVALQTDGKIVVLSTSRADPGDELTESDMLVTRFNPNGTLDTGFGGGTGYVRLDVDGAASPTSERGYCVTLQPDGKIIAVGAEATAFVARLNSDGTLDSTFGAGGFKFGTQAAAAGLHFEPNGVTLQSDGSIIIAGVSNEGEVKHPFLMRFFPTTASPLQAAGGTAGALSPNAPLTFAKVQPLLDAGTARWQATRAVSGLGSLDFRISNLPDPTLDTAYGHTISLNAQASDWGWFVGGPSRADAQARRLELLEDLITR